MLPFTHLDMATWKEIIKINVNKAKEVHMREATLPWAKLKNTCSIDHAECLPNVREIESK